MNFLNPKKRKFSIHEGVDDDDGERSFLSKLPNKKRKLLTTVSSSCNPRTVKKKNRKPNVKPPTLGQKQQANPQETCSGNPFQQHLPIYMNTMVPYTHFFPPMMTPMQHMMCLWEEEKIRHCTACPQFLPQEQGYFKP